MLKSQQGARVSPSSESLIDVLFTTDPQLFASMGIFALSTNDHLLIYGERTECTKGYSHFTQIRYFKDQNVEAFLSDLQDVPLHTMDIFSSIDDKWSYWQSLFTSVLDVHFPLHTVHLRGSNRSHG